MNRKQKRDRNRKAHWYGRKALKVGQKVCWLSRQDKNGFALGLSFGERTLWLRNFRAKSEQEIERILDSNRVFINLKK